MSTIDEKVARLPKWAQDHIRVLTSEREHLRRQLAQMGPKGDTDIHWGWGVGVNRGRHGIPSGVPVDFTLKDETVLTAYIREDTLDITLTRGSDRGLNVQPVATNSLRLFAGELKR